MLKCKIICFVVAIIMFIAGVPFAGFNADTTDEPVSGNDFDETDTSVVDDEVLTLRVTYDVPLEQEIQNHVVELCEIYEIDPVLIFAVIEQESQYDRYAVNAQENCFGLMQIKTCNLIPYGLDKPFDSIENTRVGIQILAELIDKYDDIEKSLMAYHCGEYGANQLWEQGITSDDYTESVLDIRQTIHEKGCVYYFEEDKA